MAAALVFAAAILSPLDVAIHASIAPCPPPRPNELIVCSRGDAGERSRYLPPIAQDYAIGDPRARGVARERYDLLDYGDMGGKICSTSGPGGALGCQFEQHKAWATQRAGARDPRGALYDE